MTSVSLKRLLVVVLTLLLLLTVAITASANDKPGVENGGESVGYTAISGSPLTINVAKDASYQVVHDAVNPSTPGQVYPTGYDEADAGVFLWFDGVAVGPDFDNHSVSASNSYSPWVNVSQSAVTGSGTSVDPWVVETEVANDSTGATMTVGTIYVNGNDYFRINWQICTSTVGDASTFLAADLYLQGSDNGYGFYDEDSGSVGGYNQSQDWYQIFTPVTPADHYYEGYYGDVWDLIGDSSLPGTGFDDTYSTSYIDNGAGLQWDASIDGCSEFAAFWSFGEIAIIPDPTSVSVSDLSGANSGGGIMMLTAVLGGMAAAVILVRRRMRKEQI
ncbi:MAG: hypothetical protein ACK2T3_06795 [Candidatus Promineifilaceae bacterium]|jgi:hypothetical protein